ncbi:MAG: cupin domain-containing protein [Saprospiraceae bacterium]|nr:cupin domain-containing protein [Saprospiraceae bacterium]
MKHNNSKYVLGHKITPVEVSGNYDLVLGETSSQVPGPPPHNHLKLDEVFIVIKGEMEFIINGKVKIAKAGDSIDLPRETIHTFRNASDSTCTWINIHSPKGFMNFFNDMGIPIDQDDAMKKSIDKSIIDRVMLTAKNYDMHIKI